ncbi:MAG: DUF4056 domain-containing protein [Sedimentisphaerales bacterium]|nr:DUF4056 domain-containing protein [Sedimentisphaerales bacterium]
MVTETPRWRLGSYATTTLTTRFIDANNLGKHSFCGSLTENNGIAYTCRGGHIDVTHVRIAADYVRYLYNKTRKNILTSTSEFTFNSDEEPSVYFVQLKYPNHWQTLPPQDKERIADEVVFELSQYFTYTMVTWHEVLTWFGYKPSGFLPEFPSAFSWEDNYSNLVGTRLGAQAVAEDKHDFDEAMTIAIQVELENLGVQSRKIARKASAKMRGKWWRYTLSVVFVEMLERNMDLGYVDGFVTPTLVPGVCEDARPQSYPVPALAALSKYGFAMTLEVEPKEFEKSKILRIVYPDGSSKRINLPKDLPLIMDVVKKQAIGMGYNVMPPK